MRYSNCWWFSLYKIKFERSPPFTFSTSSFSSSSSSLSSSRCTYRHAHIVYHYYDTLQDLSNSVSFTDGSNVQCVYTTWLISSLLFKWSTVTNNGANGYTLTTLKSNFDNDLILIIIFPLHVTYMHTCIHQYIFFPPSHSISLPLFSQQECYFLILLSLYPSLPLSLPYLIL